MFILKLLGKLFKALRSGQSPAQLAGGFILGMIIGLTPMTSLHNLVVLVLLIVLNVNLAMAIFSFLIFSAIAFLFDPAFHSLGYWLLVDVDSLHGLWTALYNIPVIALSRFNNTIVLSSLLISLLLCAPFYFLTKKGVVLYREKIDQRIQKLKIVQILKSSKIYGLYDRFHNIGD